MRDSFVNEIFSIVFIEDLRDELSIQGSLYCIKYELLSIFLGVARI